MTCLDGSRAGAERHESLLSHTREAAKSAGASLGLGAGHLGSAPAAGLQGHLALTLVSSSEIWGEC